MEWWSSVASGPKPQEEPKATVESRFGGMPHRHGAKLAVREAQHHPPQARPQGTGHPSVRPFGEEEPRPGQPAEELAAKPGVNGAGERPEGPRKMALRP